MPDSRWELAVSSLGAPGSRLRDFLALAGRHGCSGVELRAGPGGTVDVGMSPESRVEARDLLRESGVQALSVASYVRICSDEPDADVLDDLLAHLELAADLGAGGVRIFPGGTGSGDDRRGRRRLRLAAAELPAGVALLLETHDSHPRAADVERLLDAGTVQVIWDIAHTIIADESPADSARLLADRLALVQVKDVTARRRGAPPALPGHGVLALDEVVDALQTVGYVGPLSLEWEKAWFPEIPDLDIALTATRRWLDGPA